jgi:Mrp family chromosome partitioning ATPase
MNAGLAEVLDGKCSVDDAIVHWEGRLDILPAGALASSPHGLHSGDRFINLIDDLKTRYGRIVIDLAPLLSASEVLKMVTVADGVLLCARKDRSRASQIKQAHQRLRRAGITQIGAVLNGMPSSTYAYYYGEYHT